MGRNKKGIQNKPMSEERKQYLQSRNLNCSWFSDGINNEISHANISKASASSYKIKTHDTDDNDNIIDSDSRIQGNAILNLKLLEEAIQESSSCKRCHGYFIQTLYNFKC